MIAAQDRDALRRLAGRVREIADLPDMQQRREAWYRHNALEGGRPMVLCFPEGAWRELLTDDDLACRDQPARAWERQLRTTLYWWDHIADDAAIDPCFNLQWHVRLGDYGVPVPQHRTEQLGSYVWDPPIKDIDRDFHRLRFREKSVDREGTMDEAALAEEVFGDLLPVRLRSRFCWTMGLTWEVCKLIGLEQLMVYMFDDPDGLHRLMAWIRDEHMTYLQWMEDEGLLTLNNAGDYVGSGGLGYTRELPRPDLADDQPVRLIDRWGHSESQETVGVGPSQFVEFILPYQVPLQERFGLNCYGCCEPLDSRIDPVLAQVPRLRRLSVSPWADQQVMADKLGDRYIFSRKPNPSLICVGFEEEAIRHDIRQTLEVAGQLPLEIIMKDTHTVQHQPWRITRWVELAREEVERFVGARAPVAG
jgi:hypothetical protein